MVLRQWNLRCRFLVPRLAPCFENLDKVAHLLNPLKLFLKRERGKLLPLLAPQPLEGRQAPVDLVVRTMSLSAQLRLLRELRVLSWILGHRYFFPSFATSTCPCRA